MGASVVSNGGTLIHGVGKGFAVLMVSGRASKRISVDLNGEVSGGGVNGVRWFAQKGLAVEKEVCGAFDDAVPPAGYVHVVEKANMYSGRYRADEHKQGNNREIGNDR